MSAVKLQCIQVITIHYFGCSDVEQLLEIKCWLESVNKGLRCRIKVQLFQPEKWVGHPAHSVTTMFSSPSYQPNFVAVWSELHTLFRPKMFLSPAYFSSRIQVCTLVLQEFYQVW